MAHRTGAIDTKDLERVAIDTTVQEKAIAHPTDARLTHRAIEKLVELAKREGVELRQSYLRLAKRAAIMVGRYTHAHQFKRARRTSSVARSQLPPRSPRPTAGSSCFMPRRCTATHTPRLRAELLPHARGRLWGGGLCYMFTG